MTQQPLFDRNHFGGNGHLKARRLGIAAEYRLAAELLDRGHDVAFPAVDNGYDLLVNGRIRVQVKASSQWHAIIGTGKRYGGAVKQRGVYQTKPFSAEKADFVACYSRKTFDWWFIPAREIIGHHHVNFGDPLYCQHRNRWGVFEEAKGDEDETQTEEPALPLRRDQGAQAGGDVRRLRGEARSA